MGWVIFPQRQASESSPSPWSLEIAGTRQLRVMVSSWLLMCWARLFYLAIVFFLTVGLLKAIKLYLRRLQLQRDLHDFSGPSPHWLTGNQQVDGREE